MLISLNYSIVVAKFGFERLSGVGVCLAIGNKGDIFVNHHMIKSRDYTQVKTTYCILTL
jgi:hypothetical protein